MIARNHNEQLQGAVKKNSIKEVEYQGLETSSVKVTVDNDRNTIKADIVFDNILGTTADKAFPGHLGTEAHKNSVRAKELSEQALDVALNVDERVTEVVYNIEELENDVNTSLENLHDDINVTIKETEENIIKLLTNIKFMDGGTSSIIGTER